jgi:hypothetical protein
MIKRELDFFACPGMLSFNPPGSIKVQRSWCNVRVDYPQLAKAVAWLAGSGMHFLDARVRTSEGSILLEMRMRGTPNRDTKVLVATAQWLVEMSKEDEPVTGLEKSAFQRGLEAAGATSTALAQVKILIQPRYI